jgi:hypothetical protein
MKTTRTYSKGCDWCNATGLVPSGLSTTLIRETCPVCNGNKLITVTEIIEETPDLDCGIYKEKDE